MNQNNILLFSPVFYTQGVEYGSYGTYGQAGFNQYYSQGYGPYMNSLTTIPTTAPTTTTTYQLAPLPNDSK